MYSYARHASNDIEDLIGLLDETLDGAARARNLFEALDAVEVEVFAKTAQQEIREFLGMTVAQRKATVKRYKKANATESGILMLIVLAINAALAAKKVLELRDLFSHYLVPGLGNRETVAALSNFAEQLRAEMQSPYGWPDAAFIDSNYDDIGDEDEMDGEDDDQDPGRASL
jgi:hypothetical protein